MSVRSGQRRIVVCADDFGCSEPACTGIIALCSLGAISAVSSIIDGQWVERYAPALKEAAGSLSLGLHLNLTETTQFSAAKSLPAWVLLSYLVPRVYVKVVRSEIARQLDAFERIYGQPPAFVDGHEHVHQLPTVRQPLLEALLQRYGTQVSVRTTVPAIGRGFKANVIARLGGHALRNAAQDLGLHVNRDFAGVYDFSASPPYEGRMLGWIRSIADRGLIMCHPEYYGAGASKAPARAAEYLFLSSARWLQMRNEWCLKLVPFSSAP